MKNHCCDDDNECFAPDSDYNYEDVDCNCECDRCMDSVESRWSLSENDELEKDQKPKFKTDTFASYYNESTINQMKEVSYRDPDTLEMRWDHTGDNEDEPKHKWSYEDEGDDDPIERLSDEEMDRRSDAQWEYEDEMRSQKLDDRFDEADEPDAEKLDFGFEFDPNFKKNPDELFSYGKTDEGTNFDKFIDKILISEGHGRLPTLPEDNPQRRRAAKRQDRPANRTVYGRIK